MPGSPGPAPGTPPVREGPPNPTLPPNPNAQSGGGGMPDYWAAFGAYTVLFLIAGGTTEVARIAAALAWSMALVVGIAWIQQLSQEGRAPFGSAPFWR